MPDEPLWPAAAGGGVGGPAVIYDTPENHGAKGDGVTDDTAAIQAAIDNVVAEGRADGSYYGEVWFASGKIYQVAAAAQANRAQPFGGTSLGNAQISLPWFDASSQKFTLVLRGVRDASAIWSPGFVMTGRATLRSTMAAQQNTFATYGNSSVIGGATSQQNPSYPNNLLVVIDGLTIITPNNAGTICAIDLGEVADAKIGTLNLNATVNPNTFTTAPAAGALGLRMPTYNSMDNSEIDRVSIMGYTYALIPGEHTVCKSAVIFYCKYGVVPMMDPAHGIYFGYLSTEGCTFHLSASQISGPSGPRIDIGLWDVEDVTIATTYHLDDATNRILGQALIHRKTSGAFQSPPLVNGGAKYRLINGSQPPGVAAPPAVPGASTNLQNPFWRDAFVQVAGGTAVAVTVDGQAFPTAAPIPVRAGGVINLGAYTVAPAWTLYLL